MARPDVPELIDCIDCGGVCHLLTHPDERGRFHPGEIVAYRCEDCLDSWYLEIPPDRTDRSTGSV